MDGAGDGAVAGAAKAGAGVVRDGSEEEAGAPGAEEVAANNAIISYLYWACDLSISSWCC